MTTAGLDAEAMSEQLDTRWRTSFPTTRHARRGGPDSQHSGNRRARGSLGETAKATTSTISSPPPVTLRDHLDEQIALRFPVPLTD